MNAPARTYGKLAVRDGEWIVGELEPHVAMRLKALFPKVEKASRGPFRLGRDAATAADLAWFTSRYPLAAPDGVLASLDAARRGFEADQAEVGRIMADDYAPPDFAGLKAGERVELHQARAAELLSRFGGLLVADDVGEGKTYTGAAALLGEGALPGTVVCPPHLRSQWRDKLVEFTTLRPIIVQGTKPYALPPADVRIFSYTQLQGWADMLDVLGTGLAVFDEVHALRNGVGTPNQPVARGVAALRLCEVSRMRLGLTATPIFNYGDEIWRIMQFIRPGLLGSLEEFTREWCGVSSRVTDPEALGSYLREQHAMVRKRGSAPEPNIVVVPVEHDAAVLEDVEAVAHRLAVKARTGTFVERGRAVQELDMLLRQATGIAKAPFVAAFVRILIEAGESVILFGWHRAVYDIWLAALSEFNPVLYTGSETPKQKEASKDKFLSGASKLFIMSLRSGEGVDGLQAVCSTAVVGELDWSPSVHKQNFGRINRRGQICWPNRINGYYLVADDGSDPPIMEILGLKASQAHGIVDPGLGPQRVVSDTSALERLVMRYIDRAKGGASTARRSPSGHVVNDAKLETLARLAGWPNGTGAISGVLEGGTLAALVQFELADRIGEDRVGGLRYRINAAGLAMLRAEGLAIGEAAE